MSYVDSDWSNSINQEAGCESDNVRMRPSQESCSTTPAAALLRFSRHDAVVEKFAGCSMAANTPLELLALLCWRHVGITACDTPVTPATLEITAFVLTFRRQR